MQWRPLGAKDSIPNLLQRPGPALMIASRREPWRVSLNFSAKLTLTFHGQWSKMARRVMRRDRDTNEETRRY
jgi:hypothetical protein